MPKMRATVRRWGSSLGFIVPRKIVTQLKLKASDEVVIEIDRPGIEDVFGSMGDWAVEPQRLVDELRRGW